MTDTAAAEAARQPAPTTVDLTEREARTLLNAIAVAECDGWPRIGAVGEGCDRTETVALAVRLARVAGVDPKELRWED